MAAIPVSAHFQKGRVGLLPNGLGDLGDLVAHFAKVHSIDNFSRDVVALRPIDDLFKRCRSLYRCAHGEEVVFANEYDRQFIKRGEIQSFVESSLIDRAVTEEAKRDPIFVPVLGGKSHSHRQRNVGANNSMTAVHVIFPVEKMHGATQALRAAGLLSKKLCHTGIRTCPASERVSVIAISGNDVIVFAHSREGACYDGFLTNVKMTKAAYFLRLILLTGAFLKAPDQQHKREHLDFVALLPRLHGGYPAAAGRNRAARARELSALRPKFMEITKSSVNRRSLISELRKNIQLGVALY